jgi:hypothetical protein
VCGLSAHRIDATKNLRLRQRRLAPEAIFDNTLATEPADAVCPA